MVKPRVGIASLGGTITMVSDDQSATVVPRLSVDDLIASVPAIAEVADLSAQTLQTIPGASLQFADIMQALSWARLCVEGGHAGVVLVQGTDTIEETAYLLDLHWDLPQPIVVTGAMRSPATAGSDGPANLLASIRVAASTESRDLGTLVVLNDEVHAAARVRKIRASGVDAFASPGFGPVGYVEEGVPVFGNRPARWPSLPTLEPSKSSRVALIETYLGDDGGILQLVAGADFDGVVVAGFGVGHVPPGLADALSGALETIPVVFASRTGSGSTFTNTYGFPGSESDLLARGAIGAGWLDARKARILLARLVAAGYDRDAIRVEFKRRGGAPAGPRPDFRHQVT